MTQLLTTENVDAQQAVFEVRFQAPSHSSVQLSSELTGAQSMLYVLPAAIEAEAGLQKLQNRPSWDPAPDVRSRLRQRLRGESAWEEVVEALCCMRIALVQANAVAAINELMRATGPFNKVGRPETAAISHSEPCQRIFLLKKPADLGWLEPGTPAPIAAARNGHAANFTGMSHIVICLTSLAEPCRSSGRTPARGW